MFAKRKHIIVFALLAFLIGSCTASRFVEPLDKGEITAGFSFGGPVIGFAGAILPVPLANAEVGYGVDSNLTVVGGVQATSLYFNNLHIDAGVTYKVMNQKKYIPNVSVSPSFQFVYDFNDKLAKFWPVLDVNAYWNYGERRNYFYAGINNYFELSKTMALEQEQEHRWLFSPQIGHVVKGKKDNWQLTTELKFLGITHDNSYAFLPYKSLTGSYGATGFYIGCRWFFNRKK